VVVVGKIALPYNTYEDILIAKQDILAELVTVLPANPQVTAELKKEIEVILDNALLRVAEGIGQEVATSYNTVQFSIGEGDSWQIADIANGSIKIYSSW